MDSVGLYLKLAGERVNKTCQRLDLFGEPGDLLSLRAVGSGTSPFGFHLSLNRHMEKNLGQ